MSDLAGMQASWRKKRYTTAQRVDQGSDVGVLPPLRGSVDVTQPGWNLVAMEQVVVIVLMFFATHVTAFTGMRLWMGGTMKVRELDRFVPLAGSNASLSLSNVSDWMRFDVTVSNYTSSRICERCCMNGNAGHSRGVAEWSRNIRFTVLSSPMLDYEDIGNKCGKPQLPVLCNPAPCNLFVWCQSRSCEGSLLWQDPVIEMNNERRQAVSDLVIGPLLLIPALMMHLYLLWSWLQKRFFVSQYQVGTLNPNVELKSARLGSSC